MMRMKSKMEGDGNPARAATRALGFARNGLARSGECGSTLVETALMLSIMLLFLLGSSRLCIGFYTMDFLSEAAREGARWKIVRGNTCSTNTPGLDDCGATAAEIQTHVQSLGFPYAHAVTVNTIYLIREITFDGNSNPHATWVSSCTASSSVLCNSATADDTPGNQVTVSVSYTFPLNIPFMASASIPMTSNSSMVIAQ